MRIPLEFFEQLRQRIPTSQIVSSRVQLTRKGNEFIGLCPFHNEKTPSFTVNDIKKFYHCFGCGVHGDSIKFVAETNGISYQDAAIKIAESNGIAIPRLNEKEAEVYDEIDRIQRILELTNNYFKEQIWKKENKHVLEYLEKRGITIEVIKKYDIGFAPNNNMLKTFLESKKIPLLYMVKAGVIGKKEGNITYDIFRDRITFPIKDVFDKVIAFGARTISNLQPKYLNSPETIIFKKNETLYGENKATAIAYKKNRMIIVEGYLDAISMQTNGFEETVASLGTAVTVNHLNKIWKNVDEIVFCLDGDLAGFKATVKALESALPLVNGTKVLSFVFLPQDLDPDSLIKKYGIETINNLINSRLPLSQAIWYIEIHDKIIKTAEDFASLENKLANYIKSIKDPILSKNLNYFFKGELWKLRNNSRKPSNPSTIKNFTYNLPELDEISLLEYAILSYLIKYPDSLENENILEFVTNLEIENEEVAEIRSFIFAYLDEILSNKELKIEKIENLFKNSRFFDLYVILSKPNSVYLNTQFLISHYTPELIWGILLKRYNLAVMKREYKTLLGTFDEESFRKAQIYKVEIENLNLELQKYVLENN